LASQATPIYAESFQEKTEALTQEYANLPVENYELFKQGLIGLQNELQIAGQDYYAAWVM
jgi:hypothetical protein